jgi:hypothetical protein
MKKCPFCAEDIQDAAIVCKHCGRELSAPIATPPSSAPPPEPKKKTSVATWGCLGILALLFLGWCSSLMNPSSNVGPSRSTSSGSTTQPAPDPSAKKLALLSSRGYESEGGGYHIIEGQVKNISNESLKSVAAKGTWYAKDGTFITSDDTLIDFDPLLPDQTSTFKVMSRSNPAMAKFSVEFKYLLGGSIPTTDQRRNSR